jgi:hypothetical protein
VPLRRVTTSTHGNSSPVSRAPHCELRDTSPLRRDAAEMRRDRAEVRWGHSRAAKIRSRAAEGTQPRCEETQPRCLGDTAEMPPEAAEMSGGQDRAARGHSRDAWRGTRDAVGIRIAIASEFVAVRGPGAHGVVKTPRPEGHIECPPCEHARTRSPSLRKGG